ncbi:hypothetical protein DSO57_1037649 [Entomophthora muscae]|uniref:Uncharacterized protein n=1 Tax=Entomophthora muscae TaxID=34485 RepID=A0ACC2SMW2_9FUNG|nr:hypothetical protein DSO57_1037649 [Entomophthora muscae]
MAFQARPVSPVGVQLDSGMGCDILAGNNIGVAEEVDQPMEIRALLKAAAECLLEVEIAFLQRALEDLYEGICLSLFEVSCQILMLLLGWGGFLFLGLGLLFTPSGLLGLFFQGRGNLSQFGLQDSESMGIGILLFIWEEVKDHGKD